jgi:hypothetical protein
MSSADTPKTVDLGGTTTQHEAVAGGAITPGQLVTLNSSGQVVVHPSAGLPTQAAFAIENDLVGKGIADAYASGEQVRYRIFAEGGHVYAILASGQNVAQGALLQSAGNGNLSVGSTADNIVAKALEAVNASGGAARIRVEILKGYNAA